jgi:hypothetical protein
MLLTGEAVGNRKLFVVLHRYKQFFVMKYIELTQGKRAMVDDEDYEELSRWRWCVRRGKNTYYAVRGCRIEEKQRKLPMHRVIMNTPQGMDTDHINGDGLDNRKCNLRVCTRTQNNYNIGRNKLNVSGYKGVGWHKSNEKWRARIRINKKRVNLGYFETPELAYQAYCNKAKEVHGEFAHAIISNL